VYWASNGLRFSSYALIFSSKDLILSSTLNSATDFSTLPIVFLAWLSLEISLSNCFSSLTVTPASISFSNFLIWASISLTFETESFCLALRSSSFFFLRRACNSLIWFLASWRPFLIFPCSTRILSSCPRNSFLSAFCFSLASLLNFPLILFFFYIKDKLNYIIIY